MSGVSHSTLDDFINRNALGVDVLSGLCTVPECEIGELLEFIPPEKRGKFRNLLTVQYYMQKNSHARRTVVFCSHRPVWVTTGSISYNADTLLFGRALDSFEYVM